MTLTGNKQLLACMLAMGGMLAVERTSGYCMRVVRQTEEYARGKPDGWLWGLFPANTPRSATGVELAALALGWGVPLAEAQPGDWVFNRNVSAPDGHVGRIVARNRAGTEWLVLENTTSARGVRLGGALALTRLSLFGPVTAVIRPPENL